MKILLTIGMLLHVFTVQAASQAIPNFHQVTNEIYRGGRPSNDELTRLFRGQKIHTIIDVENNMPIVRQEKILAESMGMRFVSSPMEWEERPSDDQVDRLLTELKNSGNFPIFLHCRHGRDRTGLIMALYRVEVMGWSPERAYKEMLDLGFGTQYVELDRYFRERTGYTGE